MKVCEYCDGVVEDSTITCPYCSATRFKSKCRRCGTVYDGGICPTCQKESIRNAELAEKARQDAAAAEKANSGLPWKIVLTVFVPFVGGYFAIRPGINKAARIFAMVWCSLFAFSYASLPAANVIGMKVILVALMLAPYAAYLINTKDSADTTVKAERTAFAVVLAICLASIFFTSLQS